jgi:hypothetical protein
MADMEDIYRQNAVRLENIKAGESSRIAIMIDEVQAEFLKRMDKLPDPMTHAKYVELMTWYYEELDKLFLEKILPRLGEDGEELVTQQLEFHAEALAEIVTGKTKAQRDAELEAEGYDTSTALYMMDRK